MSPMTPPPKAMRIGVAVGAVVGEGFEEGFDGGEALVLLAGGDFEDGRVGGKAGEESGAVEAEDLGRGDDEGALLACSQAAVKGACRGGRRRWERSPVPISTVVAGGGGADRDDRWCS